MSRPLHPLDRRNPWMVYSKEYARQMRHDHGFKKFRATRSDKNKKKVKKNY